MSSSFWWSRSLFTPCQFFLNIFSFFRDLLWKFRRFVIGFRWKSTFREFRWRTVFCIRRRSSPFHRWRNQTNPPNLSVWIGPSPTSSSTIFPYFPISGLCSLVSINLFPSIYLLILILNSIKKGSIQIAFQIIPPLMTKYPPLMCIFPPAKSPAPCKLATPASSAPCWLTAVCRSQNRQVLFCRQVGKCYLASNPDALHCSCSVIWRLRGAAGRRWGPPILWGFCVFGVGFRWCRHCRIRRRSRSYWGSWGFRRTWRCVSFWGRRGCWFNWWRVVRVWGWSGRRIWGWLWRRTRVWFFGGWRGRLGRRPPSPPPPAKDSFRLVCSFI